MTFTLHGAMLDSARRFPDRVALRCEGAELTYEGLAQRSARIARALQDAGVQRGDRVALYMNRGLDSMSAVFGILRAGAGYVPFDNSAPPARLASILTDCDVRHIVVDDRQASKLSQLLDGSQLDFAIGPESSTVANRIVPWGALSDLPGEHSDDVIESDLSVIYYTSGSTGRPKGVAHDHRSMLSNVEWALREFSLHHEDRFSHVTSHHFDLSWLEMFASMAAGGALCMYPESTVLFPSDLSAGMERDALTVWVSVPSVLMSLVSRGDLAARDLSSLRSVMFAGERYPTKHLRALLPFVRHARVVNMYGTSETHIAAFWDVPELEDDEPIPIGKACAHVNLAIVDGEGNPVPDGDEGELAIRGPSMMQSYWRLEEKTAAALRPVQVSPALRAVHYHAGDLARRRPDGNIEIIGRGDRRVKVRGFLVDLDEVEAVLLTAGSIREIIVVPLTRPDGMVFLVAAALAERDSTPPTGAALRVHAGRVLPVYAVPERIDFAEDLPRTGSGKISRKELQVALQAEEDSRRDAVPDDGRPVIDALRDYLKQEVLDGSSAGDIGDEEDLIGAGILTSIDVIEMVEFLERRYGVPVPNAEFRLENFHTLRAITALVERIR